MISANNNTSAPFRVTVERVEQDKHGNSMSKGRKFYAGADSMTDAKELADAMNAKPELQDRYLYRAESSKP